MSQDVDLTKLPWPRCLAGILDVSLTGRTRGSPFPFLR